MDRQTTMNKFTLLKFPHSTDEIITERIESLNRLIVESDNDEHVIQLLEMIIGHLTLNFDGLYVEHCTQHLLEAIFWWKECYCPEASLAAMQDSED